MPNASGGFLLVLFPNQAKVYVFGICISAPTPALPHGGGSRSAADLNNCCHITMDSHKIMAIFAANESPPPVGTGTAHPQDEKVRVGAADNGSAGLRFCWVVVQAMVRKEVYCLRQKRVINIAFAVAAKHGGAVGNI